MLYYVLKVGKATPNIAEVIHWISSGARVPIPAQFKYFSLKVYHYLYWAHNSYLAYFIPVFDLVGALHSINIHADFELNMRWDAGGPGIHIYKDKTCPELAVLQEVQGPVSYCVLIRQSHKLIQDHTLDGGEWIRELCDYVLDAFFL